MGKCKWCGIPDNAGILFYLSKETSSATDAATEIISISKLFLILECYVLDLKLTFKQVVQKINQQVLAELLTEETLEAPIGKGVDVSTHKLSI